MGNVIKYFENWIINQKDLNKNESKLRSRDRKI